MHAEEAQIQALPFITNINYLINNDNIFFFWSQNEANKWPVLVSWLYLFSSLFNDNPGLLPKVRESKGCFGYLLSSILLTQFNEFFILY
jgi:hypothetical protein